MITKYLLSPYFVVGILAALAYGATQSWQSLQTRRERLGPDATFYKGIGSEAVGIAFGVVFYLPFALFGSFLLVGIPCLLLSAVTGYELHSDIQAKTLRNQRCIKDVQYRLQEATSSTGSPSVMKDFYAEKARLSALLERLGKERQKIGNLHPLSPRTERGIYDAIAFGAIPLLLIYAWFNIDDVRRRKQKLLSQSPPQAQQTRQAALRPRPTSAWWLLAIPPAFSLILLATGYVFAGLEGASSGFERSSARIASQVAPDDVHKDERERAASLYNVPSELIRAIAWAESENDPSFVSTSGRTGLMGLTAPIAKDMLVEDSLDPSQNIMGAARYLRTLANSFDGDMLLTVAAYRAGPEAVTKSNGVPESDDVRSYCKKVMAYYRELKQGDLAEPASQSEGPSWASGCFGNCSEHRAGYAWAKQHNARMTVCDEKDASPAFVEGCRTYVVGRRYNDPEEESD